MNTIRRLTPFERGQAALADSLAHTDWAPDSDERLQWVAGLQAALDGAAVPAQHLIEVATAAAKVQALEEVLYSMARALAPIVGAHLKGDRLAVARALEVFMAKNCKIVTPAGSGALQ